MKKFFIQLTQYKIEKELNNLDFIEEKEMSIKNNEDTLMPFKRIHLSWYPTLEKTLVCLSKIYLTLDVYL